MEKRIFTLTMMIAALMCVGVFAQNKNTANERGASKMEKSDESKALLKDKKILITYFSHSGNTREIANQIHRKIGGDIFEIKTVQTYSSEYDTVVKQARKELDSGYKPQLKSKVKDMELYDVIFVGYPNWWGTIPMAYVTFFTNYNFAGKTIIPFCTHEGSGMGRSVSDIKKLCPKSKVLDGLAIRGSSVRSATDDVYGWLRKIGLSD
jgi:flavodoxin